MERFPNSYKDPAYDSVDSSTEQKLGIPAGLLSSIRLHGEKSNADQVSSAGARTPYQITPSTRKLILKKYGIDPYLSPELASEGAGLLLQESLKRNADDIESAIGEYHGGTDRKNWGAVNKAYRARVVPKADDAKVGKLAEDFSSWAVDNPAPESTGSVESDFGAWLAQQKPEEAPKLPPTTLESAQEAVTGAERQTPETEALPDWSQMPEYQSADLTDAAGWKASLGRVTAAPEEAVQILQANKPDVQSRRDEKGNIIIRSGVDGKEYAVKPGFEPSDIPRAVVGSAMGYLGATSGGVVPAALSGAAVQGGIEATQAATGGSFDAGEVALAGGLNAAVPLVSAAARPAINAIAPKVMQGVNAVKTMGSRGAQAIPEAAPVGAGAVLRQADDVVQTVDDVVPTPPVKATQAEIDAIQVPDAPVIAKPEMAAEDFGALARKASEGSRKAQEELAAVIDVNPEAKAAADALGLELPADLISDSKLLQQSAGLSRGIVGEQSSAWRETVTQVGNKADEALAAMDGSTDVATLSESVKNNLAGLQKDLKDSAEEIYTKVNDSIPKSSKVEMPKTLATLKSIISEVGYDNLSATEKRLFKLASGKTSSVDAALGGQTSNKASYGTLLREKSQIGDAIGSAVSKSPYGSVESGALKRLYASLADDQLNAVETAVGGEAGAALRSDLRYANQLTAKRKGLEKRIVNAFGKEGEGSIASKLTASIKSGAKGDVAGLNKVLKVVPKDMQKETIATALMNAARTPQGNFSPNQFTNLYQGIRKNAPVAKTVFGQFSKEENEMLRNIYAISKRTRDAENAISKTGKANQPLYDALIAQNAIGSLLDSAGGRMAQQAASAIPSGGAARAVVGKVVETLTTTPVERMTALNKLLGSAEFSDLLESASKTEAGAVTDKAVKKLAVSKVFADFIKSANMPRDLTAREKYITAMLQGGKGSIQETEKKGEF